MDTSDDSILNNHTSPTLELIDMEGLESGTDDYYSKLNTRKNVSYEYKNKKLNE